MAWNAAPTTVTVLPNGVKVATQETFSEIPSVGVFIDAGYRSHTTPGTAHLVEQLLLSGTQKNPKAKLVEQVETMGGSISAKMGREQTSLTMSVFKSDVKVAVEILADIVANPGLANLESGKAGMLQTLEGLEAPSRDVIDDRLHLCAFRDSTLGLSTLGPFENIAGVTVAHLQDYVAKNFTSDKIVLAASGAVKHADLVKLAEASFGGLKAGPVVTGTEKPYFCGAEINYRNDEMGPTAYLAVGFEGVPAKSADAPVLKVMQHIIGSYKKNSGIVPGVISGNRVINGVANKMGVGCADEFEAFSLGYKDTGLFGFYAACDEVALEHCLGELMFGLNMMSHSVTEEEVARARRELRTALVSGAGSSADSCADIGSQMLTYGRVVPPAEMTLRIDAIDAEEVKRAAWQYLADNEVSIAALGPTHGLPPYLEVRRMTNTHRY